MTNLAVQEDNHSSPDINAAGQVVGFSSTIILILWTTGVAPPMPPTTLIAAPGATG